MKHMKNMAGKDQGQDKQKEQAQAEIIQMMVEVEDGYYLQTADGEAIIYREFDDNNKVGIHRDAQRFVVGSDGKVYFSNDHYLTLVEIVE